MKLTPVFILAASVGLLTAQEPLTSLIPRQSDPDTALVLSLLGENLSKRTFSFPTVAMACSGKKVLPLTKDPAHLRVTAAIGKAVSASINELNKSDSPARTMKRINECSELFEDAILKHLNEQPGINCMLPATREGNQQRSGYPDLRVVDQESKQVFYIDPKLVESGHLETTLRTFYFEPKNETLKINDDAVHLLVGIEHDGKVGEWTFSGWRLIDLSKLKVRLKAEFQASNAEVYQKSELHAVEAPAPPEPQENPAEGNPAPQPTAPNPDSH